MQPLLPLQGSAETWKASRRLPYEHRSQDGSPSKILASVPSFRHFYLSGASFPLEQRRERPAVKRVKLLPKSRPIVSWKIFHRTRFSVFRDQSATDDDRRTRCEFYLFNCPPNTSTRASAKTERCSLRVYKQHHINRWHGNPRTGWFAFHTYVHTYLRFLLLLLFFFFFFFLLEILIFTSRVRVWHSFWSQQVSSLSNE